MTTGRPIPEAAGRSLGWVAPASTARRLAAVRIAIGGYALAWSWWSYGELVALGRLDDQRFRPVGIVAVLGTGPVPGWAIVGCWWGTVAAALGVMSGRRFALAGPALAGGLLLLTTYQNSWGKILHTENLLVVHALVLAVAPAGDALVLGARTSTPTGPSWSRRYGWPLRAMAIATVLTYVAAGVAKVRHGGLGWMTADNLRHWIAYDLLRKELFGDFSLPVAERLLDHGWLLGTAAIGTVVVELAAPLALLGRRCARTWITTVWLMHLFVLSALSVAFPYQLLGVAFLPVLLVADDGQRTSTTLRPSTWRNATVRPTHSSSASAPSRSGSVPTAKQRERSSSPRSHTNRASEAAPSRPWWTV